MMVRRNKLGSSLVGRAETKLEGISEAWSRAVRLIALLRPTLGQPLTQSHVERLARAAKYERAPFAALSEAIGRERIDHFMVCASMQKSNMAPCGMVVGDDGKLGTG